MTDTESCDNEHADACALDCDDDNADACAELDQDPIPGLGELPDGEDGEAQ